MERSGGGSGESNNGSSGGGSSRWNPTKEQISMLEGLYKQGIRTPSAEQIQHITSRLRAYGHIEGKNVFYWFQNHKARQRQKQKQESFAYLNRFLHHHQPLFPPPLCPSTVLCAPYYTPQSEVGYYGQHQKMLLPGSGGFMRRMPINCEMYNKEMVGRNIIPDDDTYLSNNQETLPLFPLKPTGFLEEKTTVSDHQTSTDAPSSDDHVDEDDAPPGNQPFYDFMRQ